MCPLKDLQKLFMRSLLLHTSCLFSMHGIVDIEKPDEIRSFIFAVDELSELYLHPSI